MTIAIYRRWHTSCTAARAAHPLPTNREAHPGGKGVRNKMTRWQGDKMKGMPVSSGHPVVEPRQLLARLGQLAAHAQALEEVDGFGEGGAGGGEVAAEGVEASVAVVYIR